MIKQKNFKEKGITLIALVITIIVLLILAGVSLNLIMGNDGILGRAENSVNEHAKAEAREKLELVLADLGADKFTNPYYNDTDFLIDRFQEENMIMREEAGKTFVKVDDWEFEIDKNKLAIISGGDQSSEVVPETWTVTFDANGGNCDTQTIKIAKNTAYGTLPQATRDGYNFLGWYTEIEDGTQVQESDLVAGDVILYARWAKNIVTITFHGNGKTATQEVQSGVSTVLKVYSATGINYTGYVFKGWAETENGEVKYTDGANIEITQDIYLYGVFEKDTATASLNITNNGTATSKLTEGTKIVIGATASTGIQKVDLKIGSYTVYSSQPEGTEYTDEIEIDELTGLDKILFYSKNTATLTVTSKTNKTGQASKTNVQNFTIGSANSLKKLAEVVNGGETLEGETVLQIADIDLSSICSSTKGSWEPIGYTGTTWFAGTYNGNEKQVTNIYINNSEDKIVGLFGFLGYVGTVKNLTVSGNITQSTKYSRVAGGVVGRNEGTIDNCINNATVIANDNTGVAGGVAGLCLNTIKNCINNGRIQSEIAGAGGITGNDFYSGALLLSNQNAIINYQIKIENCTNNGEVSNIYNSTDGVGGIIGNIHSGNTLVDQCTNNTTATIKGINNVGGICGNLSVGQIKNCVNKGNVIATSNIAGGIVGICDYVVLKCHNKGNVTSQGNPSNQLTTQGTGGIAGRLGNVGIIQESSNTGNISSEGWFVGGIVGLANDNSGIYTCYNYNASISAKQNGAGGIVGRIENGVGIVYCYNYLSSTNYSIKANGMNAGGIIGVISYSSSTDSTNNVCVNCYNIGENIIAQGGHTGAIIGGIGYSAEIDKCYYLTTSTLNGIGYIGATLSANNITKKDANAFKSAVTNTSSVAYLLNGSKTSGSWSQSSSINGGYPYLVDNIPE